MSKYSPDYQIKVFNRANKGMAIAASTMRVLLVFLSFTFFAVVNAQESQELTGYGSDREFSIIENLRVNHAHTDFPLANLLDAKDRMYFSGRSEDNAWSEAAYLEVDIKEGKLIPGAGEDIFVMIRRYENSTYPHAQPTMMAVKGSVDGNNWKTLFYAYFLFRGPYTTEYSEAIPVAKLAVDGQMPSKLRFEVVTTNNNRRFENNTNSYHPMGMTGFDVIKIKHGDPYNATMRDRTHLLTDHLKDLDDFSFNPSEGIVDPLNCPTGWDPITDTDRQTLQDNGIDITLPEFSFLTSADSKYDLAPGQNRQRTHTIEHIVYAIPGDMVMLYPYYGMTGVNKYEENFSHWYNYKTGGRVTYEPDWGDREYDLLDFLNDPSQIQVTKKAGYFGGQSMNYPKIIVDSEEAYISMVDTLNQNTYFYRYVEITKDLDFKGMNVPMIKTLRGAINGNGHKISNLVYQNENEDNIGLVRQTEANTIIENLVIDASCKFIGKSHIGGIVGKHNGGNLTLKNIHTEATVYGTNTKGEQAAAGLIGFCDSKSTKTLIIEDCYVGGVVGNPATNITNGVNGSSYNSYNAVLIAWWETQNSGKPIVSPAYFKNIIVECKITGYEITNPLKRYVRHRENLSPVSVDPNGVITQGQLTFEKCFGNIDFHDKCWSHLWRGTNMNVLKDAGWYDYQTPPMDCNLNPATGAYARVYHAENVKEYCDAVNEINKLEDRSGVYFYLLDNIDFTGKTDVPMLGDKEASAFNGIFNGNGFTISNLEILKPTQTGVGLIGWADNGVHVENLIIAGNCHFKGKDDIGIIGRHRGGHMSMTNIKSEAFFEGTGSGEHAAGGVLGKNKNTDTDNAMFLKNIYIGGIVGNPEEGSNNGAIAGWFDNRDLNKIPTKSILENIVVECDLNHSDSGNKLKFIRHKQQGVSINLEDGYKVKANFKFKNCFDACAIDVNDECWEEIFKLDDAVKAYPEFEGWTASINPPVKNVPTYEFLVNKSGSREPGTVATFFCPRNPYDASAKSQSLPFEEGEDEFIIAADFSQTYDVDKHLDRENHVINAPLIAMRHIFRIRDGKVLAEQLSGSSPNNKRYLKRNRRIVSARAGVPFQIRLSNPAPMEGTAGRTNLYYKVDEDKYSRVCEMETRVLDAMTKEAVSDITFRFGEKFSGQGSRTIDGVEYLTGDAGKEFYRMLECDNPKEGSYIVQIIGKDDNGEVIKIYGTQEDLVVMEYEITFLPKQGASMLTEEDLYSNENFKHARIEYLNENYGGVEQKPRTFIDFDEYIKIHALKDETLKNKLVHIAGKTAGGMDKAYFKWPIPWEQSDYSFGYDKDHDYNMYKLATHSSNVPYHAAADNWKGNRIGEEAGLFDRLYYRKKREETQAGQQSLQTLSDTEEPKQGYFYYVNAATDPGVTARLNINNLCSGSTIHVSAWMAEFSSNVETANLSFNFVAVLKDNIEESIENYQEQGLSNGARITLHQFITGYVPSDKNNGATSATEKNVDKRGEWLNIYYSFIPRQSDFLSGSLSGLIDHYEIELDNNSKNSTGADYAIDDIRAYVESPTVEARQLTPVCGNNETTIRIASPFDTLLEVGGQAEADEEDEAVEMHIYYVFLDKEKFDNGKAKLSKDDADYNSKLRDVFMQSLVQPSTGHNYGSITFYNMFSKHTKLDPTVQNQSGVPYRWIDDETGERLIVFENNVMATGADNSLQPEREYYLVMNTGSGIGDDSPEKDLATFFDMSDEECASKCEMVIIPSSVVKVEGVVEPKKGSLVICENTSPIIQANVTGVDENGEPMEVKRNALFDWFYGSIEEYKQYKDDDGKLLEEALGVFRLHHPEAKDLDGIEADEVTTEGVEPLKQWMLDIIGKAMTHIDETKGMPLLTLYQRSFIVPPVTIPEGEEEVVVDMVAIPIPLKDEEMPENVLVCTDPTPLSVTVGHKAPKLLHGFSGIEYPENLADVPLRIGLDQIREEKDGAFIMKTIEVPVRLAESPDKNVTALGRLTEKDAEGKDVIGCIVLVQSNDPEYSNLGAVGGDDDGTGEFPWVGEVTGLQAGIKEGSDPKKFFTMRMYDNFKIKEGYFYKLRFNYTEKLGEADKSDAICNGQDLITLKIVPKYQLWTGAENLNWNNDANWSRLDAAEINSVKAGDAHRHFLTDGVDGDNVVNSNKTSYAPLDFTYVVVKDGVGSPYMYSPGTSEVMDDYGKKHEWSDESLPGARASATYSDYPVAGVGAASELIHFDMVANTLDEKGAGDPDVRCRPWYANTCREIHFKPGGTIMNQQLLRYTKAWVDVELDHSRWQTLSTPLKEVYAGDFYLPSNGAREKTELFTELKFDNKLEKNNRFKPAVYQRGWDKATANVYELDAAGNESGAPRNVAVKTFWSHVYNDVAELYGSGNGFSLKTDVSQMDAGMPAVGEKVLFRLPKSDDSFFYFTQDGVNSGHRTTTPRTDSHFKLNDSNGSLTTTSASEGQYFLVGNPFMTHMDIRKLLQTNNKVLDQKYWIITQGGQIAGTLNADGSIVAADPSDADLAGDPTVVAPMQGFFVKTLTPSLEVSLSYGETMMRRYDGATGTALTGTTRSGSSSGMRIVSENDGVAASAAILFAGNSGIPMDVEAVDSRDLDVSSVVYTVKDGMAMSISSVEDLEGIEIGVIADAGRESLIRFSDVEAAEGMYLLDRTDRSLIAIEEGLELTVSGPAAGRFFLTRGLSGEGAMSGIDWSVSGAVLEVTDNASSGLLSVEVFDTLGRIVRRETSDSDTVRMPLEPGLYVVEMKTLRERKSIKVKL